MKSIITLSRQELADAHVLARTLHNAICSYHLLRGYAPTTLCVHPSEVEHVLVGVVEQVIFPKGIALRAEDSVAPGTMHLTAIKEGRISLSTYLHARGGQPDVATQTQLLRHALQTN